MQPRVLIQTATSGTHTFVVEVASSDADIRQGLMCREALGESEGMLFLFQQRDRHSFWMKNTPISLDIVFMDDDMRVVDIIHRAQPMSYDIMKPRRPGRFVLEVAAGECLARGIAIGDAVDFDGVELVDEHCAPSLESTAGGTLGSTSYRGSPVTFDVYPVDPATAKVTSLFASQEPGLRTSPHRGMDFGVPVGTPVKAPWPGTVERVFQDAGFPSAGGGNVIFMRHPNGLRTAYLHLSQFKVTQGQQVAAGDVIGLSGNTGGSTGPHLHFEVRQVVPGSSDVRLNPLDYMPGPVALSASLAAKMGVPMLAPAKSIGIVGLGLLAFLGFHAFRIGKQRRWF